MAGSKYYEATKLLLEQIASEHEKLPAEALEKYEPYDKDALAQKVNELCGKYHPTQSLYELMQQVWDGQFDCPAPSEARHLWAQTGEILISAWGEARTAARDGAEARASNDEYYAAHPLEDASEE